MKDIIYEFLDYLTHEKKYSHHTEKNYEIDLFKYEQYLESNKKNYLTIKHQELSNYLIYLKKSGFKATSINRNLSALKSFYNYLIKTQKIKTNPFGLIKRVRSEKRLPNHFKDADFLAMLKVTENKTPLDIRNTLILELLLATGLRVGEISVLKLKDINLANREIKTFGKGKKERIVYFSKIAENELNNYLTNSRKLLLNNKDSDYLLINNNGTNLTDRGIRLIIENIIKKAAIKAKVSPHTFRHTFATMMLSNGGNIKTVQELLGHADINTTSIYTHLTNEEVRRSYLNNHPRAKK